VSSIDVSVVVPTRNRAVLLGRLLDSLRHQSLAPERFELIVVDDGSTDSTPEVLMKADEDSGLQLRTLRRPRGGPASARNAGWRLASAPLVAFTDDDCIATPNWLERLLAAALEAPGAMIQGRTEIDPAEADEVGPFSRTLEITERSLYYATCNMLYPTSLLERLGGFDESYPLPGGEDTDLGWRAIQSGALAGFAPDAVVYHGVVQLGPIGKLRWALHWSHSMQVFRRHPGFRAILTWKVFWKRTHALFTVALLGALLARRMPAAALLALPYLRMLRARCLVEGYSLGYMPYLALYDAVEVFATARGAVAHRVPIL
jgi:glycosyltransferase involved in cell wall biosynthesis